MQRQLLLATGCLMLLIGWMSAFLFTSSPQFNDFYYLIPTLLLGCGMGVILKLLGKRMTAVVLAITAVASVLAVNQFFPAKSISLAKFKKRISSFSPPGNPLSLQVPNENKTGIFSENRTLFSKEALEVKLFALLPGPARMLTWDDAGNLYVTLPKLGAIYRLNDQDNDGYAEQPVLYAAGLDRPHGLAWQNGKLLVAETARLVELQDADADGRADQQRVILADLPDDGGHWTRSLAVGQDGNFYLSIGSRCNACEEDDSRRGTVLQVDPDSGAVSPYAKGLRNAVGLSFDPTGKQLWASDNGRDMLGDDLPPDEINLLQAGGDYGWPFCFGDRLPDPQLGHQQLCQATIGSLVDIQPHSAPLGICFGAGLKAPEEVRNSLFVALHGSWNRSVPSGYKLIRIPFKDGRPGSPAVDLLNGWLHNGKAWGRPVAPSVGPDGRLYLSDDRAQAIYRISWLAEEEK